MQLNLPKVHANHCSLVYRWSVTDPPQYLKNFQSLIFLTSPNWPSPNTSTNCRFSRGNCTTACSSVSRSSAFGTAYTLFPLTPWRFGMLGTFTCTMSAAAYRASYVGGFSVRQLFIMIGVPLLAGDTLMGVWVCGGRATIRADFVTSGTA